MNATGALGRYGEDLAARLLAEAGMTVLARNWRCGRAGEIDIVARDGDTVVVCEVKTRRAGPFQHPMAAVTPHEGGAAEATGRVLAGAHRRAAARWRAHRPGGCGAAQARRTHRRACAGVA